MHKLSAFLFPLFLLFSTFYLNAAIENYSEKLFLSVLPNGDIVSIFNFTVSFQHQPNSGAYENESVVPIYVPWLFRHLFEQHSVEGFHLSMTQGFWRTNLWGNQHLGTEAPSGTELVVEFSEKADNLSEKWFALVNVLNGLFCTSILGMFPQYTVQPKLSIGSGNQSSRNSNKWYGALSYESVCTENLKSWKKLLPCKQSGLVMLMKPMTLLSARFHSIIIKAQKNKNADGDLRWDFALFGKTVHDAERFVREYRELTLESLFDRKLDRNCPVSSQSQIIVSKDDGKFNVSINQKTSHQLENEKVILFDLNQWDQKAVFDLEFQYKFDLNQFTSIKSIGVHTFVESINQIGGRITTQITNPFPWPIVDAKFMQIIPWQFRILLHTLNLFCLSTTTKSKQNILLKNNDAFTLALDGKRPLLIELQIELPPNAVCKIEIDYEAAFLKITDFPPDANSGIPIPGAVLTIPLVENYRFMEYLLANEWIVSTKLAMMSIRIFGEPLLVLLPVPDFSMPFNVICLVCTAIAVYYGNVFALSTKLMKLVPKQKKDAKPKEKSTKQQEQKPGYLKFLNRIRAFIFAGWHRICALLPKRLPKERNEASDTKKQE